MSAALGALGVRVARRSGDLTIVLASDYLEERLDAVNRRHLSAGTPWLLAQPSGIFPLVGPVFRPGEGACWACLAERMRRNREIKAFLDRSDARCVATSPLVRDAVGQGAVQLAAVEIAKAIATGFRTDLRDHVVSLDLMGSSVVRHYVSTRPQCPVCGRAELRDPSRAPAPIALHSGNKLVMTSGGYRAVSPRATVAKFRKHVSPLTGVVSRLERVDADVPLNTNYLAKHNFAPRPETVDELRSGLSGSSYGKGSTSEQGEASALMEAIERYSGIFQGDEIRVKRRFTDFPEGDAVPPNDVMLFSEAQYRQGAAAARPSATRPRRRRRRSIRRPRSSGRRCGRCATSASSISRRASSISSTRAPATTRRSPIPTAAPPATPSKRRSTRAFSSSSSAIPMRCGGTTGCSVRRSIFPASTTPMSAS